MSVLLAVGCTAIAGVEDPERTAGAVQPTTDSHPSQPAPRDAPGSSSTTTTTPSAPSSDAGSDAATKCDVPPDECTKDAQCGCGKCNQAKECAASCKKTWDGCNPGDDAPCCFGLYCSVGTGYPTCQACLGKNANVPFLLGQPNGKACCSGKFEWQGSTARCD